MADLVISERDAERLREIARREKRSVEEIVAQMIDVYTSYRGNWEAQTRAGGEHRGYITRLYAHARATGRAFMIRSGLP